MLDQPVLAPRVMSDSIMLHVILEDLQNHNFGEKVEKCRNSRFARNTKKGGK